MAGLIDVATKLAKENNLTVNSAKETIVAVMDTITEMAGTETVRIGKHTFKTVERKAKTCRNPRTGEPVEVAARSVLVYKHAKPAKSQAVAPEPESKKKGKKK